MNKETLLPLVKSISRRVLGIKPNRSTGGGTIKSNYCYSVWMRHLIHLNKYKSGIPEVVAELGPGDSLGIGFCALLSGSDQLHALDIVKYWDTERNIRMFDNLVELFKNKASIPCQKEFSRVIPTLTNYEFPSEILSSDKLKDSLNEDRLQMIRNEILDINNPNNTYIRYHIPWSSPEIIEKETVDFVYSQSVLQYIEDLEFTYGAINQWLKPGGIMSHSIDLSSIGITKNWNSHWTFSDFEWNFIKKDRSFTISRHPLSKHMEEHLKNGFDILENQPTLRENPLKASQLAERYKNLSQEDLTTCNTYILSAKK
ncbi:methyltransferase domain-containing protein [Flavobacteriaceae bacterium M23B6Z8]